MQNTKTLSRRQFLKLSLAGTASIAANRLLQLGQAAAKPPHILIFVFDAMSARNLSVYGYPRQTTPFLEQFAERATVYHSHYAGGNFTSPGTSTLLTGLYPWNHRAYTLGGLVTRHLAQNNLFQMIGDEYFRVAYAQNIWADLLLRQFRPGLDQHVPITTFSEEIINSLVGQKFLRDSLTANYAIDEFLASSQHFVNPMPGSLSLGLFEMVKRSLRESEEQVRNEYPYGRPFNGYYYYQNRTVFDGLESILQSALQQQRPVLAYFHFFSPHDPYTPLQEYAGKFPELKGTFKAPHPLSYSRIRGSKLNEYRTRYDEYIANVDAEFGRLLGSLRKQGFLENSYVIVASDHGEVFERGEYGHASALLYDPIMHIPLLIAAPGQRARQDVYTPTSNADVLPTLLHLAGKAPPNSLDGTLLPGLGGTVHDNRTIFALEAKENSVFLPLTKATVAMVQGRNKLVYYRGYPKYAEIFEHFDLENDPEEKKDLFPAGGKIALEMKAELLDTLANADKLFKEKLNSKE